jgi:glyoxylase-like metal-dependent hydrolase (beta-lactamase superfamily II)
VIVERALHPSYLSNTYLVADRPRGRAVVIDAGGPLEPILGPIEELGLRVDRVLCTHHHADHVAHVADLRSRFDCPVCAHAADARWMERVDVELADGDEFHVGELAVRALHVPGHTQGQMAFLVGGTQVFTGDTLFRRAVGGTRAPGHATFEELQRSILDVLMRLPAETIVHPGHTEPTTVGEEWERNPFIRLWRGLEQPADERCTAFGQPATLLLRAEDYDGGTKCQVRFDAGDRVDVVPGSRVR